MSIRDEAIKAVAKFYGVTDGEAVVRYKDEIDAWARTFAAPWTPKDMAHRPDGLPLDEEIPQPRGIMLRRR